MYTEYLDVALAAVKEAEAVVMKYLDQGVRAELKEDQSPVTVADREAEETVKRLIAEKFPDHTFFGEEGEKVDLTNHQGFTWVIDPIDGTKSYLRGNPLFSTLVALLHDGEFVLGISNAPLMREMMYASKGGGCFLNGEPVQVSDTAELKDAYMSFGSIGRFAKYDQDRKLVELAKSVRWARGIGDAWSYHLVAQGKAEVMVEAEAALWDVAAFKVIVEEAGGRMTQITGEPLSADGKSPISGLATNGQVHEQVVNAFR